MKKWSMQCERLLLEPGIDTAEILKRGGELAGQLGFDWICYQLQTRLPVSSPRTYTLTNAPATLQEVVARHRAQRVLPVTNHVLKSAALLYWPLDEAPTDAFYRDIKQAGVQAAWSMAASDRVMLLGKMSAGRASGPITDQDCCESAKYWKLTECMDEAVRPLVRDELLHGLPQVELTDFERSVMCWAADGKSAWETAHILGVEEYHIVYQRRVIKDKLGANNLADSVSKAMVLGMLSTATREQT